MAQLNWWDHFWIGLSGASPKLAAEHSVDVPALRTFGYQLAALWLLFFVIQGVALTVITQSVEAGMLGSGLSSTILILAERTFVNGDWYNEGHYWTLHEENPDDPELRRIERRRFAYTFSRLVMGITISIAVVTLAEPGLFRFEQDFYARQEAKMRAPGAEQNYQQCIKRVSDIIDEFRHDRRSCAAGAPPIGGPNQNRLNEVNGRIDSLEAKRSGYLERYSAECGGRGYNSDDPARGPTGRVGCKAVANSWKSQADALLPELGRYRDEKSRLDELIRSDGVAATSASQDRLRQCPTIEADLRNALATKQTELAKCAAQRRFDGGDPADQKGGLMRTIQYHLRMKADSDKLLRGEGVNPDNAGWYLFALKVFVVFLESALFLSKILGRVRGYAKAVYRLQTSIV